MFKRTRPAGLILAIATVLLVAAPAAAAGPVTQWRDFGHKEVSRVYYPDDICGPRAGWTDYVVSWHFHLTEISEGVFNWVFGETGTYHVDFDDPSIPDLDSQFTEAQHGTVTKGGTETFTFQFHDFPGSIAIHEQYLFVRVGDEVKLDRYTLRVDGCP